MTGPCRAAASDPHPICANDIPLSSVTSAPRRNPQLHGAPPGAACRRPHRHGQKTSRSLDSNSGNCRLEHREFRSPARFRESVFQPQRIHAKTGFIRGTSALSGYLLLPDRRIAVFSFLVNFDPAKNRNTNNARFKVLQEEFLAALLREES